MKLLKISIIILTILSTQLGAQIIKPQTINYKLVNNTSNYHMVNLNMGYDYNLIGLNLGYSYYMTKYKSSVFFDFTQGTALLGTGNFRTQLGIQTWQGTYNWFNLKSTLAFVYSKSTNKAGNYNALGLNFTLNPGVTLNRFSIGADLQFNPFLLTHIEHSDYWKTNFYENTKDGWYSNSVNNFRMGVYASGLLDKF
jgi:hypothetical protein